MSPVRARVTLLAPTCRSSTRAATWLVLFVLLLAQFDTASAQRIDLAPFQDSITGIRDIDQLRSMLAKRASRAAEASPVAQTERGFIALRLYDLTSQRAHRRLAETAFKSALKRDPEYGWAHYGLGLTYMNEADAGPGTFVLDDVLGLMTGNDARARADRELTRAMAGQPSVARAADELAANAVSRNRRNTLEKARTTLQEHLLGASSDGNAWYALARVDAELGEVETAAAAMDSALAHGVNSAEASHTRALVLLRLPGREAEGAQAWFAGLQQLTPELADDYFSEIAALLSDQQRADWQRMTLTERADTLRTFWDMRAALGGVTVTERIAEHYRRLAIARQRYYRESKLGAPAPNELIMLPYSRRSDYDDRGLIYIRHGAPRARIALATERDFESWVYPSLAGSNRMFHFEKVSVTHGFSLMHDLSCDENWLRERARFEPRLGKLLAHCDQLDLMSASADARQVAFDGLATDSDQPAFTKELPFFFDLYTFRANEGRTSVVAAVAVPREKLNISAIAANPAYRIDLSLILVDTVSRNVIREDDSVALAPQRENTNDDLFRLHVEVAVPPSRTTVQRVIVSDPSEPGIGQLYGGPFPIPDYSGSKLMLSDVVLAEPGIKGRWHRGNVSLALVPTRHFKGGSFNVFYEIYNISNNSTYSTEIEIEPLRKSTGQKLKGLFGGRSGIKLKFEGEASNVVNGTLQELRRVDTRLEPGDYRMKITVKNLENGETARNERVFLVPK